MIPKLAHASRGSEHGPDHYHCADGGGGGYQLRVRGGVAYMCARQVCSGRGRAVRRPVRRGHWGSRRATSPPRPACWAGSVCVCAACTRHCRGRRWASRLCRWVWPAVGQQCAHCHIRALGLIHRSGQAASWGVWRMAIRSWTWVVCQADWLWHDTVCTGLSMAAPSRACAVCSTIPHAPALRDGRVGRCAAGGCPPVAARVFVCMVWPMARWRPAASTPPPCGCAGSEVSQANAWGQTPGRYGQRMEGARERAGPQQRSAQAMGHIQIAGLVLALGGPAAPLEARAERNQLRRRRGVIPRRARWAPRACRCQQTLHVAGAPLGDSPGKHARCGAGAIYGAAKRGRRHRPTGTDHRGAVQGGAVQQR